MADKVKIVVADSAFEEFFRRAREHARALDRGETVPGESVVIVEEPKAVGEVSPVPQSRPSRISA